ncbi:MAG: hypothetical protein M1834_001623 [Cirrosporium novae-zelandiae]|nr:MAG: hypothetical protein M1834_004140 [Cirrosporium novae-zelandiae]KAI9735607.1 MAG: hypothetical protein M1834_001623 [Cirrosporium novae-zelandiae]
MDSTSAESNFSGPQIALVKIGHEENISQDVFKLVILPPVVIADRHSAECLETPDRSLFQPQKEYSGFLPKIKRFWGDQISVTVTQEASRDHFALERIYLAYLHTSLTLAMAGVFIAQLFRMELDLIPNLPLDLYTLGIPLAALCQCAAIIIAFLGGVRFLRQQNAIVRGKVLAGGWDMLAVGILLALAVCPRKCFNDRLDANDEEGHNHNRSIDYHS